MKLQKYSNQKVEKQRSQTRVQNEKKKGGGEKKNVNPLKILKCFWNKTINQEKQRMLQIYASKTYPAIWRPVTFGHTQADRENGRANRKKKRKNR